MEELYIKEEMILIDFFPENLEVDEEILLNLKNIAQKVLKIYGEDNAQVSISITNNEEIHKINKEYRNINRETDVISFALNEKGDGEPEIYGGEINYLGEIIISIEKAKSQALEYNHSFKREITFLLVHGLLHLLGYDHIEEEDKKEMRREEEFLMEELKIPR